MGRRFGRNQKRRAREEIAALRTVNDQLVRAGESARHFLAVEWERRREAESQLDHFKAMLGKDWVGFMPEQIDARLYGITKARTDFRVSVNRGDVVNFSAMQVENTSDDLLARVHFRAYLGGGSVWYCASIPALLNAPAEPMAQAIAREMAPALLENIKKIHNPKHC